jgi:hypothetical protein
MPQKPQDGDLKSSATDHSILGYSQTGDIFSPGTAFGESPIVEQRRFSVLRPAIWRSAMLSGQVPSGAFTRKDILTLPYEFPAGPKSASAELARTLLTEFQAGNLTGNTVGIEEEGDIYQDDGTTEKLVPKYDGVHFTDKNDAHPEMTASKVETATGPMANGLYASSALEIAKSLACSTLEAYQTAQIRSAFYVQASVSEGGHLSQVKVTDHPYILTLFPIRAESYKQHAHAIPYETKNIWRKLGAAGEDFSQTNYGDPPLHGTVNASHFHTSNPTIPGTDDIYDARIAYTYGLLRLTQMSKAMNFCLYNTKHLLHASFDEVKDVRSYLRRTMDSAHDATIPGNATDFFLHALFSVAEGQSSYFSRYPSRGQHDRLRIKEAGTTEATDGASNPDLRLVLALAYYYQIINVFALQALDATAGDESQASQWLISQYGTLFQIIPTLQGQASSFYQDKAFHQNGFQGTTGGMSFAKQLLHTRNLLQTIGKEFPGMRAQIRVVCHMLGKVLEPPQSQVTLSQYLGIEAGNYRANGSNRGIVTDYKSADIRSNLFAQAEGTEKQAQFLATQVRDEKDLLQGFFGIEEH